LSALGGLPVEAAGVDDGQEGFHHGWSSFSAFGSLLSEALVVGVDDGQEGFHHGLASSVGDGDGFELDVEAGEDDSLDPSDDLHEFIHDRNQGRQDLDGEGGEVVVGVAVVTGAGGGGLTVAFGGAAFGVGRLEGTAATCGFELFGEAGSGREAA
jgi:hypothetical protein